MFEGIEQEPPCINVITRWNSTLVMYKQFLKLRSVLICTIIDTVVATDFSDDTLTIEEWNNGCLYLLVCKFLSGSKYPTLFAVSNPYNRLLNNCNKYLVKDLNVGYNQFERSKNTSHVCS